MKVSTKTLIWSVLGALYSLLMVPFSPFLIHFLAPISLLHTIYFVLVFLGVGYLLHYLPRWPYVRFDFLVALACGVHLAGWFYGWSILRELGFYLSTLLPFVLSYGAVFLGAVLYRFLGSKLQSVSVDERILIGVLVVFIAGLKVGITGYWYSTEGLIRESRDSDRLRTLNPSQAQAWPYPFSVPIQDGIERYGFVLGDFTSGDTVFFLVLDALRSDYLGKVMYDMPVTPNINQFSKKGVRVPNYYVQSSWTKPSTASLFTGRYLRDHGVMTGGRVREDEFKGHVLPSEFRTLAERLERRGYRNFGSVMTSHIGSRYRFNQGFEIWLSPGDGYQGDLSSVNRALFWLLREEPSKRFVYLHLKGPHHPYSKAYLNHPFLSFTPYYSRGNVYPAGRFAFRSTSLARKIKQGEIDLTPEEVRYLRTLYASQLNLYDRRVVGPFLRSLRELGLSSGSLITIMGDHGEELYDHGSYAHGANLYETTINPGFVIKFPDDHKVPGRLASSTLESIDLTATVLDYAGADQGDMSGNSFYRSVSDTSFNYALAEKGDEGWITQAAIVNHPFKLIYDYGKRSNELYNLRSDPVESNNLSNSEERAADLRKMLFRQLGADSRPRRSSVPLRDITGAEKQNLRGLGYIK
ncbi:MAG: sulfatase-like hydrolase/transferase [bacterium]